MVKKPANTNQVNGFSTLRLRWSKLPFVQVLFLKEHRSKKSDQEFPSDRTLFVANCNLEEEEVNAAFETFGSVERVRLGEFASRKHSQWSKSRRTPIK
mmetsp:Transcript_4076/g.11747  ORF Transcript_4076/g.11747 Transcript_4076/m.11747 type:complete len:98 (-) Transcript_4076:214-507(-)